MWNLNQRSEPLLKAHSAHEGTDQRAQNADVRGLLCINLKGGIIAIQV